MAGGVIIQRKAGVVLPEEYLETILKKVDFKCFGMAIVDKAGKMQINTLNGVPALDQVKAALASTKDCEVLMHFGMYPQTYSEHDLQPFPLLCEDDDLDKPLICAALSGDFLANTTGSSHLDVWHVSYEYLMDKISSIYEMCGKDLSKVLTAMHTPSFEKDVAAQIKSNGTVVFLGADGESWSIDKENKVKFKGEGWWTNNNIGWKPGQTVANDNASERIAPSDSPKRGGFKDQIAAMKGSTAPITTQSATSMAGPRDFRDAKKPLLTDYASTIPKSVLRGKRKEIIKWCKTACNQVPQELEQETDMGKIDFTKLLVITNDQRTQFNNDLAEWGKLHPEQADKPKPTLVLPDKAVVSDGKPPSLKEKLAARRAAEAAAAEPEKTDPPWEEDKTNTSGVPHEGTREFVPVIPPKEKEGIESLILQSMSDDGKTIPDPKKASVDSFASFSKCFGLMSLSELRLDKDFIWTLVQDYPVGAACLIMEYQADDEKRCAAKTPTKTAAVA